MAPSLKGAGTGTILLVEDEDGVRELTARTLILQGYQVLVAGNGQEALQVSKGFQGHINLLLTELKKSPATLRLSYVADVESESLVEVIRTYTMLGVEHILLGIDHLLFVFALLLLVPGRRMLIWTITSFTLAHSVTLAAATLGWVRVPQAPVEAVIALSILFVAMEIVHWKQGRPGITRRWPWLVAFTFGLLHGFGFAGALSEIGLPEHAIPLSLLFFNLGVEAGQLMFIAAVLLLWAGLGRLRFPQWAWRVPVYAIGSLAAFWTIERIAGFA